jgi:hypothetical protein
LIELSYFHIPEGIVKSSKGHIKYWKNLVGDVMEVEVEVGQGLCSKEVWYYQILIIQELTNDINHFIAPSIIQKERDSNKSQFHG